MEKKNIVFTVNGVEQKIEAKLVNEVFENEDGTRTSKWHSGRTVITDKFYGDRWLHKKMFDKEGQLSSELTRTFDDSGNLISICEDRADGGRDCTLYEYDDKNHCVYQKQETLHPDGSTRLYERWFKNFSDEEEFDESKFIFDKEMCYRKLDKNGRVICFVDSCSSHENEYDANGGLTCATNKKAGKIISKIIYYKSDDGMVEIQKSENFEDKAIYYEIKDSRKTPENPDRLYTLYMLTEKM